GDRVREGPEPLVHDSDVEQDLGATRELVRLLERPERVFVVALLEIRDAGLEVAAREIVGAALSAGRRRQGKQADAEKCRRKTPARVLLAKSTHEPGSISRTAFQLGGSRG